MLALKKYTFPIINDRDKDPTQTLTLRAQFLRQVNVRVRKLRSAIKKKLIEEDHFGQSKIVTQAKDYEYKYAEQKLEEFLDWLVEQEKLGILEMIPGYGPRLPGSLLGQEVPWTNVYIQSAYQSGLSHTWAKLRAEGLEIPSIGLIPGNEIQAVFNTPFHAERVGLLYTRAFNGMKNVTAELNTHLSHVLSKGMIEGRGIREIARNMDPKINTFKNRCRLIARTEVVHAHNNATLNEFYRIEQMTGREILVKWWSARDGRVREEHSYPPTGRHGLIFTKEKAETLIGEPNCRCALLPYIPYLHDEKEGLLKNEK